MSDWMIFVMSVMAVYRVSGMMAEEKGPGGLFERMRGKVRNRTAKEGVSCPLCESVWWAAVCVVYLGCLKVMGWEWVPLWWLGVSGGAVVMHRQWGKE